MLTATELRYSYGVHVNAVEDVSLSVEANEFVAVHGPSGCGKSTLMFLLGGLLAPDAGTVAVDGTDLYSLSANARAKARGRLIGFVFQRFHLIPYLSVRDNIRAAGIAANLDNPERVDELLATLGLENRQDHVPAKLSVGEQQRTALARALYPEPPLLLADEPTGNLDAENRDRLLRHLADYAAAGHAVVMVTHDEHAMAAANRRVEMREGRVL